MDAELILQQIIPRHVQIAFGELGQREVLGPRHNPRILEYGKAVRLKVTTDEIAWCSNFANWCFLQAGIEGTRSAAARSWLDWGEQIHTFELGCVAVWTRGASPAQAHVNFPVGIAANEDIACLGGNQGNEVSVDLYPLGRLLELRRAA